MAFRAAGLSFGAVSNYSLSASTNTPYPGDNMSSVPSGSATLSGPETRGVRLHVGEDAKLFYFTTGIAGDAFGIQYGANEQKVPEGTLVRVQENNDSETAQVSVDGYAAALNQEISTWPIIEPSTEFDFRDAIIPATFTHWLAQAGLFRWRPKGDMIASVTNLPGCPGYYRGGEVALIPSDTAWNGQQTLRYWNMSERLNGDVVDFSEGTAYHMMFMWDITATSQNQVARWRFLGRLEGSETVDYSTPEAGIGAVLYPSNRYVLREETNGNHHGNFLDVNIADLITDPEFNGSISEFGSDTKLSRNSDGSVIYDTRIIITYEKNDGKFGYYVGDFNNTRTEAESIMPKTLVLVSSEVFGGGAGETNARLLDTLYWTEDYFGYFEDRVQDNRWLPSYNYYNYQSAEQIAVPGVQGNGWQMLNELATVFGKQLDPIDLSWSDWPNFESPGTENKAGMTNTVESRDMSKYVEVVEHKAQPSASFIELFRADDAYSIDLGDTEEYEVDLVGTALDFEQPVCLHPNSVPVTQTGKATSSYYSVYGEDNNAITPSEWNSYGGSIRVERMSDPTKARIIIQAPSDPALEAASPFKVSIEGSIPSLVIGGRGIRASTKTHTVPTGAGDVRKRIGTTFDSPFVNSPQLFWRTAEGLGIQYGSPLSSIRGTLIAATDSGETSISLSQAFRYNGSFYIVTGGRYSSGSTSISSASAYNRCDTVNTEYDGLTCLEVNALLGAKTVGQVNLEPLKDYIE